MQKVLKKKLSLNILHIWSLIVSTLSHVVKKNIFIFFSISPFLAASNLLINPGFETGTTDGWAYRGGCTISTTDIFRTGSHGVLVTNRTAGWQGVQQNILGLISDGQTCMISGWVKLQNTSGESIGLTIEQKDSAGTKYIPIQWSTGSSSLWTPLSGQFTLNVTGTLTGLIVYFEGPASGVNFYVDDALLVIDGIGDWKTEANSRIEQIRKGDFTITALLPADGHQPMANVGIEISQIKHDFPFGSAINANISNPQYAAFFKSHFNWAVMENESKWYVNEPSDNNISYAAADSIYNFCSANTISMRGHCIFWEAENMIQNWVKALDDTNLRIAMQDRLDSAVNHFKGKFKHWDVNNEMCNNTYFINRLGASIRPWMFQTAHSIDPQCLLFLNDYNVISGGYNLNTYRQMTVDLQAQGAPIHGLGVQCHMDGGFDRNAVITRFDSLTELNLPVWVTEFDVPQADENLRANDLEDFYRIAFSHPAVKGILMWGFWQNSHWRQDCYIVNSDWTLNAAGRRFEALMNEWTTKDFKVTSQNGNAEFRGFYGTYNVILTPQGAVPTLKTIELTPGGPAAFSIELEHLSPPLTCTQVQKQGYGLQGDLNGDCRVDLADMAILTTQWLYCNDPQDSTCNENW